MQPYHTGWDNRTAEQWLDQAGRFEKMAARLDHYPQLNASFSALAQDARKRAKGGRTISHRGIGLQARTTAEADLDYFRSRAAHERVAAAQAQDLWACRAHLEMAERYGIFIRAAEAGWGAGLRPISQKTGSATCSRSDFHQYTFQFSAAPKSCVT